MSTHHSTTKAAALTALLLVGGLALAPEARANVTLNGGSLNGQKPNGVAANGRESNGAPPRGEAAEAADFGALRLRTIRLRDGRTLLPRQH